MAFVQHPKMKKKITKKACLQSLKYINIKNKNKNTPIMYKIQSTSSIVH